MVNMCNSQLPLDSTEHEDEWVPLTEDQIVGHVLGTSGYIKRAGLLPQGQYKKQRSSGYTSSFVLENQSQLEKKVEHLKSKVGMLKNFIMSNFPNFPPNEPNDNQDPSNFEQV